MTRPFTNVVIPMAFTPVYPKKCTMEHAPLSQLDSPNCAKGSVDPTEQLILSRPDRWNVHSLKASLRRPAMLPFLARVGLRKKSPPVNRVKLVRTQANPIGVFKPLRAIQKKK
jgi:hypothetical protein